MAEVLEIDGISFRGMGFGAATRTGRYSVPARRGEPLVLAGSSGSRFVANRPYEDGTGALALWAVGMTSAGVIPSTFQAQRQQFESNIQTVMRLFTRGHRLSTIRAAQADGSIRRAFVEWTEWSEPTVQAGGTRAEWGITFSIPGVWWEDEEERTQNSNQGPLPQTLDLTQFSGMTGVIEDAQFEVTGPITDPRITDMASGAWVQYSGVVSAGSVWRVNAKTWSSLVNSTNVIMATTHAGSYPLLTIPNEYSGTNVPRLRLSGSSGGAETRLQVTARRKWAHG